MSRALAADQFTARLAEPVEYADCLALRARVFVTEQGVPAELELDGQDATADHFVLYAGDRLVGTARLRCSETWAKAERVAIVPDRRGTGGGRLLMASVEARAAERGFGTLTLHAQADVIPFYRRLGYVGEGEPFVEAGIEHLRMSKNLVS